MFEIRSDLLSYLAKTACYRKVPLEYIDNFSDKEPKKTKFVFEELCIIALALPIFCLVVSYWYSL